MANDVEHKIKNKDPGRQREKKKKKHHQKKPNKTKMVCINKQDLEGLLKDMLACLKEQM